MRSQGKITRWDDEKGFGFISASDDDTSVFVHISGFTSHAQRPQTGDLVSYETAPGENGKTKAVAVRFLEQSKTTKQSTGKRHRLSFAVIFTSLFVCFLFASVYFNRIPWLVPVVYLAASCITFIAYAWDKSAARRGKWRTAESSLHLMALAGGWPGALAAQRLLRHKSSKQKFLVLFWMTVVLNVVAMGYLVWHGAAGWIK